MTVASDATIEIIQLPSGAYAVRSSSEDDMREFATEAEAEAYRFELMQESVAAFNDPGLIVPGGGQGMR